MVEVEMQEVDLAEVQEGWEAELLVPGLGFGGVEVQGELEGEYHRVTPHWLLPDHRQ